MAGGFLGRLQYLVGVDTSGVDRGLAGVEGKVKATMAALEHEDATVTLKAEKRDLDNAIREARAQLDVFRNSDAQAKLGLDDAEFQAELKKAQAQLAIMEHKRIDVTMRLDQKGQLANDARKAGRELERVDNAFTSLGRKISSARVNIGPFTLTLRSLAVVAAPLAPILFDLGGAIVALGASLSAAAGGAIAVGAGAFAGLALSATGAFFAIHPLIGQFKQASTSAAALTTAQLKYGKGSKEAKTAQQQFNSVLKEMDPAAAKVEKSWQSLQSSFLGRTGGIRKSFLGDLTDGLKTARTLMPQFARDSTNAFQAASRGFHDWMQGLRSPEAQQILHNLMSNFTDALPSLMHGLGQFATAIGRIASVGSDFFGGFARGFDRVMTDFARSTSDAGKLHSTIGGLVDQTHSWFALLGATGRLFTTLVGGGAKSGQKLVDDFTNSINRWNRALQTASGQRGMREFFGQSVQDTEQLAGALQRVLTIFFDLSRALEPIAGGMLSFFNVLGDIGHAIAQISALKPLLTGIGAVLAGMFVVNKVQAFVGFVQGAIGAITGWIGGLTGATAAEERLAAAEAQRAAAATAAAEATAAEDAALVGLTGSAGAAAGAEGLAGVEAGAAGATAEVGGLSAAVGSFGALATGALGLGAVGLFLDVSDAIKTARDEAQKWAETQATLKQKAYTPSDVDLYNAEADSIRNATRALHGLNAVIQRRKSTGQAVRESEDALSQAIKQHGKYSLQAVLAERRLQQAEGDHAHATQAQTTAVRNTMHSYTGAVQQAREALQRSRRAQQDLNATLPHGRKELQRYAQEWGMTVKEARKNVAANQDMAKWDDIVASNESELRQRLNERAAASINVQRAMHGVGLVSKDAQQSVGAFARAFKGVPAVQKFLVKTNSQQAVREVSRVGNQLAGLGRKQAVVRILGDSKNADQAFERLNRLLAQVTSKRAVVHVQESGSASVMARLLQIAGVKLPPKVAKVIGDNRDALGKISDVARQTIGNKTFNIIANAGSALSTIGAVIGNLNSIPSVVTSIINVVTHHSGSRERGGPLAFAHGGAPTKMARSMKVSSPTYLVGEGGKANMPEWVIASDPAYQRENKLYLEEAAAALGYAVIPAYAHGGHHGRHGRTPSPDPRGSKYNQLHNIIDALQDRYSNDRANYDEDINAGRPGSPSLDQLISEKQGILGYENQLSKVIAKMLIRSKKRMRREEHQEKHLKRHLHHLKHKHPKGDKAKARLEREKSQTKSKLDRIHANRMAAKQAYPDLYNEWKRTVPNDIQALQNDIQQLRDEKAGLTGGGGGTGGGTGVDQTAFGQERYQLFQQFGSNVMGIRADIMGAAAAGAAAAGAAATSPGAPGSPSVPAKVAGGTTNNKVVNVTNHYKSVPADPHSWSRDVAFELTAAG